MRQELTYLNLVSMFETTTYHLQLPLLLLLPPLLLLLLLLLLFLLLLLLLLHTCSSCYAQQAFTQRSFYRQQVFTHSKLLHIKVYIHTQKLMHLPKALKYHTKEDLYIYISHIQHICKYVNIYIYVTYNIYIYMSYTIYIYVIYNILCIYICIYIYT